jgi:hypothetical protein
MEDSLVKPEGEKRKVSSNFSVGCSEKAKCTGKPTAANASRKTPKQTFSNLSVTRKKPVAIPEIKTQTKTKPSKRRGMGDRQQKDSAEN